MNTHLIAFSEDELRDICLALIGAKIGNTNPAAVDSFSRIQSKIFDYLSDDTKKQ